MARGRLGDFEESLPEFEEMRDKAFSRPRTYFLSGVEGFKKVWDAIFTSKSKEYCIITQGENFLDYVKEKYILNEIIADSLVAFISSRYENTILLIENESFARSRRSLFDIVWNVVN